MFQNSLRKKSKDYISIGLSMDPWKKIFGIMNGGYMENVI